jgi:ubiquinone/menaquinone biosynthesis C-methylase UbiE
VELVTSAPRRTLNDAITQFWSIAAPLYDLPFLQQWVYRPAQDEVIAALSDRSAGKVADIACGTGILADRIAQELHPDEVYGVDMSDGMLAKARARSSWTRSSRLRRFISSTNPPRYVNFTGCWRQAVWQRWRP